MDDEFNLLGAAQRQQNLRQNEATRQEIAALRADLKRKEAAERAEPKCPYCAGVITGGVVKCRHCTSDIKWCELDGKSYPIKADEKNPDTAIAELKRLKQIGPPTECALCACQIPRSVADAHEGLCGDCYNDYRESRVPYIPVSRSGCLVTACTIPVGLLAFKAIENFLA